MPSRSPTRASVPRVEPVSARSSKTIATARSRSSAGCCFLDTMSLNFPRSQGLQETRGGSLRAAEDLADTAGLADVRRRVRNLVTGNLKPSYVGLALLDGQQLRWVPDADLVHSANLGGQVLALEDADPGARAARQGRMVIVTGRAAQRAGHEWQIGTGPGAAELETAVYVPLLGTTRTLGTLVLGWDTPHQVDVTEQAVLTAIAGYTARAIGRALYLDQRVTVATQLQQAMLTDLPAAPGFQLGALYRPA